MRREAAPTAIGLVVGLVLIITIFAVDALALIAAMPVIEADLGGRQWYGAVFSVFMVCNIVGIVATGRQVGRRPLRGLLEFGLVVFLVGLIAGAAAPSMFTLVLTRAVQGAGAGVLATVSYAVVASAFDDSQRPKVLAAMSTAWVVPSLIAPSGAAWVAETFHWRWVFILLVAMLVPAAFLTAPRLASVPTPAPEARRPGQLGFAIGLAGALVLMQAGLAADRVGIVLLAGAAGLAWMLHSLTRLLPPGSLVGRGVIGGAMQSKLLGGLVFLGTDAFIPLALTDVHGYSATVAGLTLTAGALTWTVGSWTVARKSETWSERTMNRAGHAIVGLGVVATLLVATDIGSAFLVAMAAWAFAGFGVGLVFATVNVVALREAPKGQIGSISASLQLADVIGFAIASGLGGLLIAIGEKQDWATRTPLLMWWTSLAVVAFVAALISPRHLPDRRATQPRAAAHSSRRRRR